MESIMYYDYKLVYFLVAYKINTKEKSEILR